MARMMLATEEFQEIEETTGTIQNISEGYSVEISDDDSAENQGIVLAPGEGFSWENQIIFVRTHYAAGVPVEVRILPFVQGGSGGGGGGGSVGPRGPKGDPGEDGFSPIVTLTKDGKVSTLTITDATSTKTTTINDGADGDKGDKGDKGDTGEDGFSPTVSLVDKGNGSYDMTVTTKAGSTTYNLTFNGSTITDWATSTAYKFGQIVIYEGQLYRCTSAHTSSVWKDETSRWEMISGLQEWQPGTTYRAGSLLYHDGTLYHVDTTFTSTAAFSDANLTTLAGKDKVDSVPIATILPYAANGTLPSGYLLCDGSAVSRTMYPDLFSAIGTTYGAGDGSTTFNLPDYNAAQRFMQGSTTAGTVKTAGLPNIIGSFNWIKDGNAAGPFYNTGRDSTADFAFATSGSGGASCAIIFDASRYSPIYGNSNTVQPPALTARYIIKAFDGQTADSALIDITQYAEELANAQLPTGTVVPTAGDTAPSGYLICDGSAISRTTYSRLYDVIGTTYGVGDGSTTFNLPNLIDRFVEGGATAGTVKAAGLPNITGEFHSISGVQGGAFYTKSGPGNVTFGAGSTPYKDNLNGLNASRSNPIYGNSTTVQPPAVTMKFMIKFS